MSKNWVQNCVRSMFKIYFYPNNQFGLGAFEQGSCSFTLSLGESKIQR